MEDVISLTSGSFEILLLEDLEDGVYPVDHGIMWRLHSLNYRYSWNLYFLIHTDSFIIWAFSTPLSISIVQMGYTQLSSLRFGLSLLGSVPAELGLSTCLIPAHICSNALTIRPHQGSTLLCHTVAAPIVHITNTVNPRTNLPGVGGPSKTVSRTIYPSSLTRSMTCGEIKA